MNKKSFNEDVTNDTCFWIILKSENRIASVGNVGGNRFYLAFSSKEKAKDFHKKDKSGVEMYWNTPVIPKTWEEIVSMTNGERRRAYAHFDLPPNAESVDTQKIVLIQLK